MDMHVIKKLFLVATFLFVATHTIATTRRGFAIVVDARSYNEARAEIDAYATQIAESGLQVQLVIDRTGQPDSLRAVLHSLYTQRQEPIEGAVLMGDIPVVMVRDAQHLTSAFKMDQIAYDRWESSVPTDRFYDDFSLEFTPLGADSLHEGCFYYSLTATSAQKTRPDIYSGRIRPTDCDGTSRYEKLRHYLRKVVEAKRNPEPIDQILFFSGNGFISESMVARIDEKTTLYEHFPWLKQQHNGISYIDHKRDVHIKPRIINEMQRRDLDYAVLHHHGDWDTEYLNNLPKTNDTKEQIAQVKLYLRESMRHALSHGIPADSVYARIARRYGDIPTSWYEGYDDCCIREKDSIYLSDLDLYLADFKSYRPECRVVSLDACFNGSFHRDSSIANAYIFSEGRTVAVLANSVNVLQDKWVDRYVGLLGLGMRVGNLAKYAPYLEQHLIGDPTFAFASADNKVDADVLLREAKSATWRRLLNDERYPALQAMAVEQLFRRGELSSDDLLSLFKQSRSHQMRMQTFINLSECRDDNFIEAIQLGLSDGYEMVERFAANMLSKSGDERLLPAMISVAIRNNTSERVEFALKQAMPMFSEQAMLDEFERQFPSTNYADTQLVHDQIRHAIEVNARRWITPMQQIMDPERSAKGRMQDIRAMRNYQVHFLVPQLLDYMQQSTDAEVQQAMLEAFGWFGYSVQCDHIAAVALRMSRDEQLAPAVRNEALKTYNRLKR
jgi:hypothetical protein